ncbi:MAG: hypothetical protein HFH60_08920, partial [Lachnospiraceae bacterium]|nr:hypothetical protein [Lachnospiraceae bacterium]
MIKKWITYIALCGLCSVLAPTVALAESRAAYQAIEGRNAQGLTIVTNPRWEYNKVRKTYKLVKKKNASGGTAYYKLSDGALQLGIQAGCYYAFDAKGDMITGAKAINGTRYYFTPKSRAAKSAYSVAPGKTTWGMAVKNDWVKVGKSWYYFNSVGQQVPGKKGLQRIHGAYYYLDKNAVPCVSRWVKQKSGAWWYFNEKGRYDSKWIGPRKINGSNYYLNRKGIPYKKCFKTVNGKKYYYTSSGKRASYTGWKTIHQKKYYFGSGHYVILKTGWQRIQKKYYYFGKKGNMYARRWVTIGGKLYYLKANGQAATGWVEMRDTYYHFTQRGVLDRIEFQIPRDEVIVRDVPADTEVSVEERKAIAQSYVGAPLEKLIGAIGAPVREAGRMPSCQGDGTGEDVAYEYDG